MRDNWKKVPLGELVTIQKGKISEQSTYPIQGFAPIINTDVLRGDVKVWGKIKGSVNCLEDDVLILWDGERSGLCAIGHKGVLGSTFAKMNVSSELVPEYLFRVVDFNYDWIQGQRTGTGVPHVPKDLKTIFKVNYPPLPQQQKIAKILSTVDAVIEQTESAIAKYQAIKQGLMHDLFTHGIDVNTGKLRPTPQDAPDLYKESVLGLIPRDWEVQELGEFIEAIDPQPSHRTPPEFHNGTPYLGINDIQNGEVQLSKCRLVNPEVLIEHKKRYSISEGDIIFGKIGTIGSPKRLSLPQSYSLSANVILIKPFRNKDLVYHYLNSKNVENQISRKIHTTSQPAFGMEKIRSLLFFNIPQIEANILEKKLNSIDQKIQTEQQALSKYQQLKAGLLQDLLTGKVAVSVD